jgi:hypothetical protein
MALWHWAHSCIMLLSQLVIIRWTPVSLLKIESGFEIVTLYSRTPENRHLHNALFIVYVENKQMRFRFLFNLNLWETYFGKNLLVRRGMDPYPAPGLADGAGPRDCQSPIVEEDCLAGGGRAGVVDLGSNCSFSLMTSYHVRVLGWAITVPLGKNWQWYENLRTRPCIGSVLPRMKWKEELIICIFFTTTKMIQSQSHAAAKWMSVGKYHCPHYFRLSKQPSYQ